MSEIDFIHQLLVNKRKRIEWFPCKHEAEAFIQELFKFLFIDQPSECNIDKTTERYYQLKNNFASLVFELIKDENIVKKHVENFFSVLPAVYKALMEDAESILKSDPAAKSMSEVIVAYPGFYATVIYRLSHELWKQGVTILPRLFCEFAHSKTGIDIHPGAQIGKSFAIDHGTGIVIGETTTIGDHVKIISGRNIGCIECK